MGSREERGGEEVRMRHLQGGSGKSAQQPVGTSRPAGPFTVRMTSSGGGSGWFPCSQTELQILWAEYKGSI